MPAASVEDGLRGDGRDNRYELGCVHYAGHIQLFFGWKITAVGVLCTVIHNALILYFAATFPIGDISDLLHTAAGVL